MGFKYLNMDKLRVVHSFWTYPMLKKDDRWGIKNQFMNNIWILTLSVIYAKRNSDIHLVLYTDNLGYELLKDLPYDEIHKDLENIPKLPFTEVLWAQGKLYAMKNEPLCSIHTDYDVFIKTKKCVETLKDVVNYDLIVQDTEFAYGDEYDTQRILLNKIGIPVSEKFAYNCGVVGFNNQELKDLYYSTYFKYLEIIRNKLIEGTLEDRCYDLNIEQENLYAISKNYKVKDILGLKDWDKYSIYNQKAIDIGYQHLIGKIKYLEIERVKRYIKFYNKNIYNLIESTLNNYERDKRINT